MKKLWMILLLALPLSIAMAPQKVWSATPAPNGCTTTFCNRCAAIGGICTWHFPDGPCSCTVTEGPQG